MNEQILSSMGFGLIVAGYLACLVLPNVNDLFRDKYRVGLDTYQLPQAWSLLRLRWSMKVP
jgi:hypothetical protein